MDLTTMRTAILTRVGAPATDTFLTTAVLTDLVNESLQVTSADGYWPWLQASTTFSTVAGTQTYTPPSDWSITRVLSIDGESPMEWRSLPEIRSFLTTALDLPRYFAVNAENLVLAPVPGGAYTVRHDYSVTEAALSANGDTPLMPSQFHYAIVAKAAELALLRQGRLDKAAAAQAEYVAWIGRMRKHLSRTSAPKRVRIRPGSVL